MNPIVVIATHSREWITSLNLVTLQKQTTIPKIVLIVSDMREKIYYQRTFPGVEIILTQNSPLGGKWQSGVNRAIELGCDPLILTGSDDILDKRFVERACLWMNRNFDFIGVKSWYVYAEKKLHKFKYRAQMPLGGGRVYSSRILKEITPIFEFKSRHLDDLGWNKVKFANVRRLIMNDPLILSIKGNWPVMNEFKAFLTSANCEHRGECPIEIMKDEFNYTEL